MRELLVLDGVWREFDRGAERGLAGVSLQLAVGEIGVVAGARGSGKTTLLRVVGGMESPQRGVVRFCGRDLSGLSEGDRARLLGGDIAWASRTGPGRMQFKMLDYVGLPLISGRRLRRREPERRARAALKRLGVDGCAGLEWSELSGWQRVGVELAQAIVHRPALLLVDDLIDGLSMRHTREAMRLIRSLAGEFGFGVLIAASDLEPGMLADRLWTLEEGELTLLNEEDTETDPVVIDLPKRRRASPGTR
jgi:putative ABC transport system ATP-binding protein